MIDLLHDSSFWVLIAFIVFITIIILKASNRISSSLEERSLNIKNKINESENTLKEAQSLLKESQTALKKHKNEYKNLVSLEKNKAKETARKYIQRVEDDIKRKEELMHKEIDYLQSSVKNKVKDEIIKITLNSVQNIISSQKNYKESKEEFEKFLRKIPATISNSTTNSQK